MPTVVYRITCGKHGLELGEAAPEGFKVRERGSKHVW